MKTLIFQHTPEEGPGSLLTWLEDHRFPYRIHHCYKAGPLPPLSDFDWLIVLGGPMNIDEEEKFPFLKDEKAYVKEWVGAGKPFLGICLGGQMLAQVLGGEVKKNPVREIGFHPVSRTGEEHPALRRWPITATMAHWHQDQFTLPPGCRSLLTSEACVHQAFALDRNTVGLQFHPEAVESWILLCYGNLKTDGNEPFVQPRERCISLMPTLLPAMQKQFFQFLEDFVEGARSSAGSPL